MPIAHAYRAGLGLEDLCVGVLDATGEGLALLVREGEGGLDLREEGQDGAACMAANDGHADLGGVHLLHVANERAGAHNIERGDSQHPARASMMSARRSAAARTQTCGDHGHQAS